MAFAEVEDADSGLLKRDYKLIPSLGLSTRTESEHDEVFLVSAGKPQAAKGSLFWEDGSRSLTHRPTAGAIRSASFTILSVPSSPDF